jgi:hypothetical protein
MDLLEKVVLEPCTDLNPYMFEVMDNAEDINLLDRGGLSPQEQKRLNDSIKTVTLVMPLGGVESGLFRSPKKFEKVLVGASEGESPTKYYLMGYLPTSTSNPVSQDFQTKDILADDGEVFRYKPTGKTAAGEGDEPYSEIGFYQNPSVWEDTKIDRINIHSTGDIYTRAVNHQEIKGKRLAILADCKEGGKKEDDLSDLDRHGDDGTLYEGDLHIRAKKRIVIKAGESIYLEAGRSSVLIDDLGVRITSKKTQSNIENYYDSTIVISGALGIATYATNIDMHGIYGATMLDGMGGEIDTQSGIVRINGKDVRITAIPYYEYLSKAMTTAALFIDNVASEAAGWMEADSDSDIVNKIPRLIGKGSAVLNFFFENTLVRLMHRNKPEAEAQDPLSQALKTIEIIRSLLGLVFLALDEGIPTDWPDDWRNGLAMAQVVVEFGLSVAFFSVVAFNCLKAEPPRIFHTSYLSLTAKAEAILTAFETQGFQARASENAVGPLMALAVPNPSAGE